MACSEGANNLARASSGSESSLKPLAINELAKRGPLRGELGEPPFVEAARSPIEAEVEVDGLVADAKPESSAVELVLNWRCAFENSCARHTRRAPVKWMRELRVIQERRQCPRGRALKSENERVQRSIHVVTSSLWLANALS